MSNYFEIKNLKVNYKTFEGTKNVLDIDNLIIKKGMSYGLVGESGAGKTVLALTILKLLATPPGEIVSGEILLEGENLVIMPENKIRDIRGNKIAMIFQDPMSTLNPVYTIGQQIINVIIKNQNVSKKRALPIAIEMLGKVNLPDADNAMKKYPHQLSGGQRQRVIIAMALSCGAEFFIADEPTRNLDVTIQAGILKLIKELQNELNVTILFIANNLGLVSVACDEIGILKNGKIIESGKTRDVIDNPIEEYTKILLESVTKEKIGNREKENNNKLILEVELLKKYFPIKDGFFQKTVAWIKAVDGIELKIRKGEVLGIVGESGCGKSTLVNTILNLHRPTSGEVLFNGKNMFKMSQKELRKTRKNIQIVFQDPFWSLNPRLLVKDIIGEPLKVHENLNYEKYLEKVKKLMTMVGLPEEGVFRYPHEFSGGERQRIAISRALSVKPELVVLDEPTSSIDVISQERILKLLEKLRKELELTYILISHDLSVVHSMSDKIIVMYLGKIVEIGSADDIFVNPKHPYTIALFNAIPKLTTNKIDELFTLEGSVPSAINLPSGCRFQTRCPEKFKLCKEKSPEMQHVDSEHYASCHLLNMDIVQK